MADPGFPRGGGTNSQGGGRCQHIILQNLAENCVKLKELDAGGGGGGGGRVSLATPLDPPMLV